MAFGLAVYVSRLGYPSPRKTRFQVLVRLSWAGFYPQGSYKRFLTHFMFVILLFQAFLAQSASPRESNRRGGLTRRRGERGD